MKNIRSSDTTSQRERDEEKIPTRQKMQFFIKSIRAFVGPKPVGQNNVFTVRPKYSDKAKNRKAENTIRPKHYCNSPFTYKLLYERITYYLHVGYLLRIQQYPVNNTYNNLPTVLQAFKNNTGPCLGGRGKSYFYDLDLDSH